MNKYNNILFCVLILLITFLLPSCSMDMRGKGTVHILSVGLDYKNDSNQPLNGTIQDALEIGECLKAIYENKGFDVSVQYMLQKDTSISENSENYPTADSVLTAIKNMKVAKQDLFVFFYSGHGDFGADRYESYNGKGFLVCGKYEDERSTMLDMDVLFDAIDDLPCASVVLIDSCYSGNAADNVSPETGLGNIFDGLDLTDTAVLTACYPEKLSYVSSIKTEEGGMEPHSLFSLSLLEHFGWKHSSYRGGYVYLDGQAIWVSGYLENLPGQLNTKDLGKRILANWSSDIQTPYFNTTGMLINIIP